MMKLKNYAFPPLSSASVALPAGMRRGCLLLPLPLQHIIAPLRPQCEIGVFRDTGYVLLIKNTLGQIIKEIMVRNSNEQIEINLSQFTPGVYFIIVFGNKNYYYKFIKS